MADQTRKLRVELTAESKGFSKAFKDAGKSVSGFGKDIGGIKEAVSGGEGLLGGFGSVLGSLATPAGVATVALGALTAAVGGLVVFVGNAIKEMVAFSGTLTDLSARTGLSTTVLQELRFAGSLVGVSMEEAAGAVNRMQRAITEGDTVFERLGLNIQKLRGLDPAGQFDAVAEAVRQIKDPTQQTAAAMEAFGKSGASILPLIKSDLAAAREEAHRLGIVLGEETVANADELGDKATKLGAAWEGFKNQIAAVIVDSGLLEDALEGITTLVAELLGPIAQNKDALALLFRSGANAAGELIEKLKGVIAFGTAAALGPLGVFFGQKLKQGFKDAAASIKEIQAAIDLQQGIRAGAGVAGKLGGGKGTEFVAQAEIDKAKKLQAEIDKLAEAERKAAIEANKRAAAEDLAIQKHNEEVRKRLSEASVAIFGTSKEAARDAALAFQDLQTVIARAGKTIDDLTQNELAAYEQQLQEIEKATRADEAANIAVRKELEKVRQIIDETDAAAHMAEATKRTEEVKKETIDWAQELENVANLIAALPGGLGKVGQALSGVTAGIAGIGAGIQSFSKAQAAGGLGGLFGQISAGLGIAGAAFSVGKAIFGLFKKDPIKEAQKKAGRALGHGISREMAEQFLREAEATGKSIEQVAKEWQIRIKAEQDQANLDTLRAGLDIARTGAETLLGIMEKLSPAAQAAAGSLVKAVQDALVANGLGFLATGDLAGSDAFKAVQDAIAGAGQVIQGFRQAGGISTDLLAQGGALAEALRAQAEEAALAAGKTAEEAQKIGLATIAPLLRDQLNASIESGKELDATTQQLLEEAKANGIEIVADPLIAQLEVQREMLAELRKQNGSGSGSIFEEIKKGFENRGASAASGFGPFFTGSGSPRLPSLQLHPHEAAFVMPNTDSMEQLSASLAGAAGGADVTAHGAAPGGVSLGGVTVVVNGAPNMSPAQFQAAVEAATARAIRLQARDVVDELRRVGDR